MLHRRTGVVLQEWESVAVLFFAMERFRHEIRKKNALLYFGIPFI